MLIDLVKRHGGNLLKTGLILLASTLISQTLRAQTQETMDCVARDVRKIRYDIKERAQQSRQEAV